MSTTRRGFLGVLAAVLPVSLFGVKAAKAAAPQPAGTCGTLACPDHVICPSDMISEREMYEAWAEGRPVLVNGDVFTVQGHYGDTGRLRQYVVAGYPR